MAKPDVHYNEPMGFPQGTVRAAIALLLVGALIVVAILSIFFDVDSTNPVAVGLIGALTSSAGLAMGYYFGQRNSETEEVPRSESGTLISTGAGKDDATADEVDKSKPLRPGPGGAAATDDPPVLPKN